MTDMKKLLEANTGGGRRRITQVFQDFCELVALEFLNAVDHRDREARAEQYRAVAGGYSPEELDRFTQVLAELVTALGDGLSDVLGELYMSLDLGNERLGQFFTPYDVSLLIARMTAGDMAERLGGREFITVSEPTCGSGGMVVALAQALREIGVNYQRSIHVTAQDIDITAVHMTYVQLTLLSVPALVVHGNTLTLEQYSTAWPTAAHVLGGWDAKLTAPQAAADPVPDGPAGS